MFSVKAGVMRKAGFELVETFYDLVETLPEGSNLRRLHGRGHGIDHARVEQFNFLSGFMGGRVDTAAPHQATVACCAYLRCQ